MKTEDTGRTRCDDKGRDWSGVSTRQGMSRIDYWQPPESRKKRDPPIEPSERA